MDCYVRMMRPEDVEQVTEIDREAFPTQWPPANYKHELRNRLARYMVVCDRDNAVEKSGVKAISHRGGTGILSVLKKLFGRNQVTGEESPFLTGHYVLGFIGFWVMADEAHITSIAVREPDRRKGIGELMMVSVIDMATKLNARILTLEVRISNTGAQKLYGRYGFSKVGIRKGYYTDNREDAIVMSTENIKSASYKTQIRELKRTLSDKLGVSVYRVYQ